VQDMTGKPVRKFDGTRPAHRSGDIIVTAFGCDNSAANILNIAGCNTNIGVTSPDIYQQCFPGALALSVALNTGSLIPKDVSVYNKDIKYTVYRSTQVANSVCFQGATRKLNPASNTWALTCHSEGNLEGIHQNCGEALNGRSVFEKRQDITA